VNHDFALPGAQRPIRSLRSAKAFFILVPNPIARGAEKLEAGDALLLRHRDSRVLRSHIGGAPVEITIEFRDAILRKTRRRERPTRLTFDLVSGQLPHPRILRYEYTTARGSTYALV
jgi:hypothetical protein